MHNYTFRSASPGFKKLMLTYTIDEKGEITADWQNTISCYRNKYADNGDFGVYESDSSDTDDFGNGDKITVV